MLLTLLLLTLIATACGNNKAQARADALAAIEEDISTNMQAGVTERIDSVVVTTVKDTTIAEATMTILYDRKEYIDRFEQKRTYRLEKNRKARGDEPRWSVTSLEKGVPKYKERITKTSD